LKSKTNSYYHLEDSLITNTICTGIFDDELIICTPKKGDWAGGDEVLMIIPKLDRRKSNRNLPN